MARDLYGEARALGVALWDAGLSSWAERIDQIVLGGATASEILMGLRWTLSELLAKEPALDAELRDRATELHGALDRALG